MAVTASVATKAGLGLGALGAGATTIYFGGDYVNNFLSNYEKALIGFLESDRDKHDIVFDVKKSGTTALGENDITFTTTDATQKVSVSVKVEVSSSSQTAFKKSGSDATAELGEIKKLNGGSNWTWQCNLTFAKVSGTDSNVNTIQASYKDRIFKNSDQGLLGILKKDFSSSTAETTGSPTKADAIQAKINFISWCGYERGVSKNKEINGKGTDALTNSNGDLAVTVQEFSFKKNENESNLIPADESRFSDWFPKIPKDK